MTMFINGPIIRQARIPLSAIMWSPPLCAACRKHIPREEHRSLIYVTQSMHYHRIYLGVVVCPGDFSERQICLSHGV